MALSEKAQGRWRRELLSRMRHQYPGYEVASVSVAAGPLVDLDDLMALHRALQTLCATSRLARCTQLTHAKLKADPVEFEQATVSKGDVVSMGLIMRDCKRCGSTLAVVAPGYEDESGDDDGA